MGLLDFNITEIAARMVRAAAVRGRIKPSLDDSVLAMAQVHDFQRAPYRLDEQKYFAARDTPAFVAGDGHVILILNNSKLPIILEWWRCLNRTNVAARIEVGYCTKAVADGGIAANNTAFTTFEGGVPFARNDIVLRTARNAGAAWPQPLVMVDTFDLPANAAPPSWAPSPVNLDLVIPPGFGVQWSQPVVGVAVTLAAQIRVVNNVAIQT